MPSSTVAPGGVDTAAFPTAAPAAITDRPLPLLDLLDGALSALRQRPRTMVTIAFVFTFPMALVNGWLARDSVVGGEWFAPLAEPTVAGGPLPWADAALVSYLMNWAATACCGVAVSRVVGGWLVGEDRSAVDALRYTLRRSWVIAAAFVMIHLAEAVGFVLLLVPGVWAVVVFSITSPVIALEEDLGPLEAMKRSMTLVRRRTSSGFGLIFLVGLVGGFIGLSVGALPQVGATLIGDSRAWPLISVSQILSGLLLFPFTGAAMCLFYLDLRFRTEGLDLELRMNQVSRLTTRDLGGAERPPHRHEAERG